MTRYAIYARYSSDLQKPTSVEDQFRLCAERVARDGGQLVAQFADHALSGASTHQRPQFQAMLRAVADKKLDVILAEALDRFSRNLSDTNNFYEACRFHGVRIETLESGAIGLLHVGMQGTMSALFLQGLAEKVRRGQRGAFERGSSVGGMAYGYAQGPTPGSRVIIAEEAQVVRRIFDDYNAGISPRKIAMALNAEGLPSPAGGVWRASAIVGSAKRGNGIFHNRVYVGEMVFGRQRRARNPETGKNTMQDVPRDQWRSRPMPEWRIVSDEVFAKAQARIVRMGGSKLSLRRRSPRLLSGLTTCSCCGGPMIVKSASRIACRVAREEGGCTNTQTVKISEVEGRVVQALQGLLSAPDLEATFIAEYKAHRTRLAAQGPDGRAQAQAKLAKAEKGLAGLLRAIEDGFYAPEMKTRKLALEAERAEALAALEDMPAAVAHIFPRLGERFKAMVQGMGSWLSSNNREAATATEIIRSLIEKVLISPKGLSNASGIEICGTLAGAIDGVGRTSPATAPDLRFRIAA